MNLRARLSIHIAVRLVVGTLLLGSALLFEAAQPGVFFVDPFFFLIGLTYGLSGIHLATLRLVGRHPWLVDLQLGADAILVSAFIFVTGGINSAFSSLYVLPIIAASTIRFRRGAMQVAALSAALYMALVTAQYLDTFAYLQLPVALSAAELPGVRFAQYTVAINLFGFLAAALLSGSLAESLRSAGARLESASQEVQDLRAFNEDVIDSLLSGLVTTDPKGRILTLNRSARAITGIEADQAIGHDVGEVLQFPASFRQELTTLGETRSVRADLDHHVNDGRTLEIGFTATTLALPNGRQGYLVTFQDVTEVRRLERTARVQQRLAAVGELAAGIAHEIRNPLASMSGSIQVLRQELPLGEEHAQLMDIVLKESERLNDTIRSFLAYARPQRLAVARLDLGKVVYDAATLLRNDKRAAGGRTVEVEIPAEPVWYDADEYQIRQIIWNLATNGLRSMADGGRLLLSVAGEAASDGQPGEVVLSVQDEGCGIPADQLDAIFQPFSSSFDRGTGLGLAIVHRIVTDYDGTIQVSSTVGAGTTVCARLPVRSAHVSVVAAQEAVAS